MQDALTGIANRRHLDERPDQERRWAERGGSWVALISLDVDFLKGLREDYGHPQGAPVSRSSGNTLIQPSAGQSIPRLAWAWASSA
jgi:diguanylate cyclase (GGDEF)-like protein